MPENWLLTSRCGGAINEPAIIPSPGFAIQRAVCTARASPPWPETSFWQSGNLPDPARSVRCIKGVCCHDPLAFLIVPSLFRAPSYPAAGGAPAAGRSSAGCLQPAELSGNCGYPSQQINTTANKLSPAPNSNAVAALLAATPTVGAPPCLGAATG